MTNEDMIKFIDETIDNYYSSDNSKGVEYILARWQELKNKLQHNKKIEGVRFNVSEDYIYFSNGISVHISDHVEDKISLRVVGLPEGRSIDVIAGGFESVYYLLDQLKFEEETEAETMSRLKEKGMKL